jgi:hypothetical protein
MVLAAGPSARAGSITLTAEWIEQVERAGRPEDGYGGIEEIQYVAACYERSDVDG